MLRKLIILLSIFGSTLSLRAQDPHFSQFYANPLYLNPAFAGTLICPRINLNYRNQWQNIPGNYNTFSASYDLHRDYVSGGLGLLVTSDHEGSGVISTNSIAGMYSYTLPTGPNFTIKAGFEARYFQKKIDWSKLYFPDQIDPKAGFIYKTGQQQPENLSKSAPDFAVGLLGYNQSYFFGAAVHHLTRPNQGIIEKTQLPRTLTVHAGGIFDIGSDVHRGQRLKRRLEDPTISVNVIYQLQQNLEQLNYGFYVNKYPMVLGAWYRNSFNNSDAFIILLGIQQPLFKIGYSYDLTVSKLGIETGGSHEISFSYKLPCRPEKKKLKVISCPTF